VTRMRVVVSMVAVSLLSELVGHAGAVSPV
jgi:hypothetical protein